MDLSRIQQIISDKDKKGPGPKPKKINPSKYNKGWTSVNGWKPSKYDLSVRDMAEKLAEDKINYIQSKEYADRLALQGNKNIPELVKKRTEALKNIEYYSGGQGSSVSSMYAGSPTIQLATGSGKDVLAHEMGHITSGLKEFAKSPFEGGGIYQSPAEAWQFISKNKNITSKQKQGIGKEYMSNIKYGLYATDPSSKTMQPQGYDVHDVGAGESKADLDGLRYLLKEKGIVKKYGQSINEDIFKKALQNKEIKNSDIFKRMRKNFSDKDIIELNNTIAKTGNNELNQA